MPPALCVPGGNRSSPRRVRRRRASRGSPVRGLIRPAQAGIRCQPIGHPPHLTAGFERADRGGGLRAREVVERRERRAIVQARRRLDHTGQTAGATAGDLAHAAGPAAKLRGDHRGVLLRDHRRLAGLPARRTSTRSHTRRRASPLAAAAGAPVWPDDHVAGLVRHAHVQPGPRLILDVGRVGAAARLRGCAPAPSGLLSPAGRSDGAARCTRAPDRRGSARSHTSRPREPPLGWSAAAGEADEGRAGGGARRSRAIRRRSANRGNAPAPA